MCDFQRLLHDIIKFVHDSGNNIAFQHNKIITLKITYRNKISKGGVKLFKTQIYRKHKK